MSHLSVERLSLCFGNNQILCKSLGYSILTNKISVYTGEIS